MNRTITFGIRCSTILLIFSLLACSKKERSNDERFRPLLHFSAEKNWTGEPSGFLYENGEYHLFYSYNPDQPVLGNIHWGHAVSSDLLHWKSAPVALAPDPSGQIYPGSVISDPDNTSGLGSAAAPAWLAFYTYHNRDKTPETGQTVALSYSTDQGMSWKKQAVPILTSDNETPFRNPHVSWNDVCGQWLMTVSTGSTIQLYTSPDCLQWSFLSEFGHDIYTEGGWESSNLFPLQIADSDSTQATSSSAKWVLLVSMSGGPAGGAPATRYFVGNFDGKEFKPTQVQELWADYGKDCYAATTCNNAPGNRRIMLGWMNSWDYANLTPTQTRRGSTTLPRELSLVPEGRYYLLTSSPVKELNKRYGDTDSITDIKLSGEKPLFSNKRFPTSPFVIRLSFDNSNRHAIWTARDYGIRLKTRSGKSLSIGYKADMNYFYTDRSGLITPPFSDSFEQPTGAIYTFHNPVSDWFILADRGSVELFACDGRIAMTSLCYPDEDFDSLELFAESGTITVVKASVTELTL